MIVREYLPRSVDHSEPPREQRIAILLQALDIPWLKEKGQLTIKDRYVMADGVIVAVIIYHEDSPPLSDDVLDRPFAPLDDS